MVVAFTDHDAGHPGAACGDVLGRAAVHPGEDQIDVETDIAGVVREHVLNGRPGVSVPLHGAADGVLGEEGPSGQRIFDREDQLVPFEAPELKLDTGGGAELEAAFRLHARTVEPEDPGLAVGGELTVGHEHGRLLLGVDAH
jgi:hypothetical protein